MFDHACLEAYEQGLITEDNALLYCTKRSVVSRGIDNLKKTRGEVTSDVGALRMRTISHTDQSANKPPPLKFK